jgi:hypothetical protein
MKHKLYIYIYIHITVMEQEDTNFYLYLSLCLYNICTTDLFKSIHTIFTSIKAYTSWTTKWLHTDHKHAHSIWHVSISLLSSSCASQKQTDSEANLLHEVEIQWNPLFSKHFLTPTVAQYRTTYYLPVFSKFRFNK